MKRPLDDPVQRESMESERAQPFTRWKGRAGEITASVDEAPSKGALRELPITISLEDLEAAELRLTGAKAANLAVLLHGGVPVPRGFCVTTAAFGQFLASCRRNVNELERGSSDRAVKLSERIGACLANVPIPAAVQQAVLSAWYNHGEERTYAVRTSATAEDAEDHSFAGQFESYLNVRGREELLEAIKKCWLSVFSARAAAYQAWNKTPGPHREVGRD